MLVDVSIIFHLVFGFLSCFFLYQSVSPDAGGPMNKSATVLMPLARLLIADIPGARVSCLNRLSLDDSMMEWPFAMVF